MSLTINKIYLKNRKNLLIQDLNFNFRYKEPYFWQGCISYRSMFGLNIIAKEYRSPCRTWEDLSSNTNVSGEQGVRRIYPPRTAFKRDEECSRDASWRSNWTSGTGGEVNITWYNLCHKKNHSIVRAAMFLCQKKN